MKQKTSKQEFDALPLLNKYFLARWKELKGYPMSKEYDFGQLLELSFALTNDLQFDESAERATFNNVLQYREIIVGWDGVQPIDILWYELNEKLKRRINQYVIAKASFSQNSSGV